MKTQGQKIDYFLIIILILLGAVSCFTLYTLEPFLPPKYANYNFFAKQVVWYVLGSIAIIIIMLIDYDRLKQVAWILYGFGMLLLIGLAVNFPPNLVLTLNNATGWYQLPGIGTLQPAELMKVFLVIALSHIIVKHNKKRKKPTVKDDLYLLLKIIIIALPPIGLIIIQPDLGSALVLSAITGCLILVSGIRWRIILTILGSIGLVTGFIIGFYLLFPNMFVTYFEDSLFAHAFTRFYGWLAPQKYADSYGLQLIRAMLAIGSGQLIGKGLMNIEVYIPERHTDMIFTAFAEQFGFLGASLVVTLFFLLIYRMIHTALESNDQFGSFLCTGIIGMITFQVFQNIGMSLQLLPITGLPLPFISYGGSSLVTYMIAVGIVLNIRSRTRVYMFD